MFVNTARQAFWRADKTILLYIIVGVNQLSCEPETLKINKGFRFIFFPLCTFTGEGTKYNLPTLKVLSALLGG